MKNILYGVVCFVVFGHVESFLEGCPSRNTNGLYWGEFVPQGYCSCGMRLYGARLWNIVGSWEETCLKTFGRPHHSSLDCVLPDYCINHKWFGGQWGYFFVQDTSCETGEYFGSFTSIGCAYPPKQRYYAKLYDVPGNWMECCRNQRGIHVNGQIIKKPAKCVETLFGVYGYFDVPDLGCLAKSDFGQCPAKSKRSIEKRSIPKNAPISYLIDTNPEIEWRDFCQVRAAGVPTIGDVCALPPGMGGCPPVIFDTDPQVVGFHDRVNKLIACVRPCHLGTGTDTNQNMRIRARFLGEHDVRQIGTGIWVSDDAGHILGKASGGSGTEARNIFPQNLRCNRGRTDGIPGQNRGWTELETYVRSLLRPYPRAANNPVVTAVFELMYMDDAETRPFAITAEIYFNGDNGRGFVLENPSNTDA